MTYGRGQHFWNRDFLKIFHFLYFENPAVVSFMSYVCFLSSISCRTPRRRFPLYNSNHHAPVVVLWILHGRNSVVAWDALLTTIRIFSYRYKCLRNGPLRFQDFDDENIHIIRSYGFYDGLILDQIWFDSSDFTVLHIWHRIQVRWRIFHRTDFCQLDISLHRNDISRTGSRAYFMDSPASFSRFCRLPLHRVDIFGWISLANLYLRLRFLQVTALFINEICNMSSILSSCQS